MNLGFTEQPVGVMLGPGWRFDAVNRFEPAERRLDSGDWEAVMRHLKTGGFSILTLALVVATSLVAAPTKGEAAPPTKAEIEQEKKEIRQKSKEILAQLYKAQPNAKTSINKAAGYAVFSNFGMKIFVAGSGKGKGVAVDNKTKKEVFMDMLELPPQLSRRS
jgi:hypothetical protein